MSKFIVIKKNTIIFIISIILIFILCSLILFKFINLKSQSTLNELDEGSISIDLNGDGKKDIIYLDTSKNQYSVKINCNSKEYILTPANNKDNFGSMNNKDKIEINVYDLSRDSIPEIIISTYIDNKCTNYIFKYIDSNFKNILSTNENLIGIINSKNTKTPFLISISSSKGDEQSRSFIFKNDSIKDISFGKVKTPGFSTCQQIIDAIEKPYEVLEMPDIFSSNISSDELALLWNLEKETYIYSFENGFFKDVNWDSSGESTTLEWTLNFNVAKKIGDSTNISPLKLYIKIEKSPYGDFKISSIKKI